MAALGAEPSGIVARTGPAVCGRCYEVPPPCATRSPPSSRRPGRDLLGDAAVDVVAGVHAQLERMGVRDRRASGTCTRESGDHFSYRRDRTTGRLAGYVWLDAGTTRPKGGEDRR